MLLCRRSARQQARALKAKQQQLKAAKASAKAARRSQPGFSGGPHGAANGSQSFPAGFFPGLGFMPYMMNPYLNPFLNPMMACAAAAAAAAAGNRASGSKPGQQGKQALGFPNPMAMGMGMLPPLPGPFPPAAAAAAAAAAAVAAKGQVGRKQKQKQSQGPAAAGPVGLTAGQGGGGAAAAAGNAVAKGAGGAVAGLQGAKRPNAATPAAATAAGGGTSGAALMQPCGAGDRGAMGKGLQGNMTAPQTALPHLGGVSRRAGAAYAGVVAAPGAVGAAATSAAAGQGSTVLPGAPWVVAMSAAAPHLPTAVASSMPAAASGMLQPSIPASVVGGGGNDMGASSAAHYTNQLFLNLPSSKPQLAALQPLPGLNLSAASATGGKDTAKATDVVGKWVLLGGKLVTAMPASTSSAAGTGQPLLPGAAGGYSGNQGNDLASTVQQQHDVSKKDQDQLPIGLASVAATSVPGGACGLGAGVSAPLRVQEEGRKGQGQYEQRSQAGNGVLYLGGAAGSQQLFACRPQLHAMVQQQQQQKLVLQLGGPTQQVPKEQQQGRLVALPLGLPMQWPLHMQHLQQQQQQQQQTWHMTAQAQHARLHAQQQQQLGQAQQQKQVGSTEQQLKATAELLQPGVCIEGQKQDQRQQVNSAKKPMAPAVAQSGQQVELGGVVPGQSTAPAAAAGFSCADQMVMEICETATAAVRTEAAVATAATHAVPAAADVQVLEELPVAGTPCSNGSLAAAMAASAADQQQDWRQ